MEITEEEEEEERERKRQSVVQEEERPGTPGGRDTVSSPPDSGPPVVLNKEQIEAPKELNFASTAEKPTFEGVPPASPTKSDLHADEDRRLSSQTARPDLYSYSSYTYGKPRVKLGPRPSLETNKRPHTASTFRPVAALPAGFKLASKGSKKGRSGSQDQTAESDEQEHAEDASDLAPLNASVTIPEASQGSESALLPPRPNTSSGASLKSVLSMAPIKEAKITPEKARLMKAMKMRQQKKKLSLMITEPVSFTPESKANNETSIGEQPEETNAQTVAAMEEPNEKLPLTHADSAIAVDLPTPMTVDTEATEDTFTDSHPPSPTNASSEIGKSTKASSLSESTDETAQPTEDPEPIKYSEPVADGAKLSKEAESFEPCNGPISISSPGHSRTLEDEAQGDTNAATQNDAPVTGESKLIPSENQTHTEAAQNHPPRESIEVNAVAVDTSDIRPQEIVLPPEEDEEAVSPKSPYGIPISKFSSNDGKSPTTPSLKSKFSTQDLKHSEEPAPALPTVVRSSVPTVVTPEADATGEELPEAPNPDSTEASAKHKISIAPIRTDLTVETPESELPDPLLDDDLLDELQSATFEEAQPMRMSVSKSPITPVFPSTSPKRPQTVGGSRTSPSRSFSNPIRGPLLAPGDVSSSSARSVSAGGAALLHNITRQPSNASLSTKKPTSSSIAQRIKALEQLSGKTSKEDPRPRTATPSSSFISVRKQNVRDSSRSPVPSFADHVNPATRRTPTPDDSGEGSPDFSAGLKSRERSGSVASRLSKFEIGGPPPSRGRPESIQVTARIIRDGNNSFPKRPASKDPAEYEAADLKQSPLVVDHLKAMPAPNRAQTFDSARIPIAETPQESLLERRMSRDRKASTSEDEAGKKRRSSLSIVKDFIKDRRTSVSSRSTDNLSVLSPALPAKSPSRPPSAHQTTGNSLTRRLSISSRSSFSKDRDTSTPLMSPAAQTDISSDDTDKASLGDKKKSRTSRFMRRLSNSLVVTSRKNLPPNTPTTVREEDEVTSDILSKANSGGPSQPTLAAYMGDVNVQFPDNLLWKRRSLCLDNLGFLVLNAINGTEKTGTKRYHLSEFRSPYIPDVDMQELPNSICLDFVEGSGLQLACEDRQGQKHTLSGKKYICIRDGYVY